MAKCWIATPDCVGLAMTFKERHSGIGYGFAGAGFAPKSNCTAGGLSEPAVAVKSMPDSPLSSRFQTDSMSCPIGVTQPMPVITTRCIVTLS